MLFTVRKYLTVVEQIHHDLGPVPEQPVLKGAVAAVITNPYVGRYVDDLSPVFDEFKALGERMGEMLIRQMGGDAAAIDGYGKGIIVGSAGEIEHGAMWHIPGGAGMRASLGKGTAIVPSTKKVAGIGARLDVPITHINASYVRSHFNAIEVGLNDAPRADEIVLILAMSSGARVHDRMGGLRAGEIKGEDGLR